MRLSVEISNELRRLVESGRYAFSDADMALLVEAAERVRIVDSDHETVEELELWGETLVKAAEKVHRGEISSGYCHKEMKTKRDKAAYVARGIRKSIEAVKSADPKTMRRELVIAFRGLSFALGVAVGCGLLSFKEMVSMNESMHARFCQACSDRTRAR